MTCAFRALCMPRRRRGCADALLSMTSIRTQTSLALGRSTSYGQVLNLATAADPNRPPNRRQRHPSFRHAHRRRHQHRATRAHSPYLRGDPVGKGWFGPYQDNIGENRSPEASTLDVRLIDDDSILWARDAAAVAIQRTVLSETRDLPESISVRRAFNTSEPA